MRGSWAHCHTAEGRRRKAARARAEKRRWLLTVAAKLLLWAGYVTLLAKLTRLV